MSAKARAPSASAVIRDSGLQAKRGTCGYPPWLWGWSFYLVCFLSAESHTCAPGGASSIIESLCFQRFQGTQYGGGGGGGMERASSPRPFTSRHPSPPARQVICALTCDLQFPILAAASSSFQFFRVLFSGILDCSQNTTARCPSLRAEPFQPAPLVCFCYVEYLCCAKHFIYIFSHVILKIAFQG